MRVSLSALTTAVLLAGALAAVPQEKEQEPFDPFADPRQEMMRRAEMAAKEKKFNELKEAAAELEELSRKMHEGIAAGNKDVINIKLYEQLDRAEKLVKAMREKAK